MVNDLNNPRISIIGNTSFGLLDDETNLLGRGQQSGYLLNGGPITPAAAVPEIDGKLMPQVVLLLASLYILFMFGRRQRNSQEIRPLLTA